MADHKQKMEAETDAEKRSQLAQKMDSWKMALTEVANLRGTDAKDRKETEFIQEVVADIHRRLPVPLGNTLPPLIGMDDEIESINSWLTDGSSNTVDILTVVGVGGIGKTSLAKYVFHLHSNKFQKSSFIEGINETCKKNLNGMLDLQKQLFGDISKNLQLQIHDVSVYASKIKNALASKKVLLVLDDVGCLEQLDALLGNEPFHRGSKIIITTKDASLTERCALFDLPVQPMHKKVSLNGLYRSKSLELLCIHAFIVKYCQGHPLALKVLGRSLQKRDVAYWEECIKVLKKEPHSQVNNTLKMSFDTLPSKNDKELFKHIACFFVGIDRDVAETILNSCNLNARYGITNLIERCLLSVSLNNKMEMHSLIQEMGRDLVRQESPDRPWERSRIWCYEESFKVLEQKQGTGNLVGLVLDMRMLEKEKLSGSLQLKTDALSKMDKLKLLQLNYVKINGSYENVSKELRWLCMHGFHLKSIPSELPLEKVVVLDMSYSKIESFDMSYRSSQQFVSRLKGLIGLSSKDKQLLGSLKILDLSFCKLLHSQCNELVHIDLSYCCKLKKLPKSLCKLNKVQTLLLDGCISRETQIQMGNVKVMPSDLNFTLIPLLKMSSLTLLGYFGFLSPCEIDDVLKIQDMASVEEKISSNWEMYYEFGIFSMFYNGKEMPDWINCRSKGPSISFTIPSSINNLRGLNFLCILKKTPSLNNMFEIPAIEISNITETHTWVYNHYIDRVDFDGNKHYYEDSGEGEENYEDAEENYEDGEEYCLCYLSHWMFGPNEMKAGDHIIIEVRSGLFLQLILECGIGLVYDDDDGKIGEEEKDVLGYYKSWNHIIGGDLSPFQTTTGEYILDRFYLYPISNTTAVAGFPFNYGVNFKGLQIIQRPMRRALIQSEKHANADIIQLISKYVLIVSSLYSIMHQRLDRVAPDPKWPSSVSQIGMGIPLTSLRVRNGKKGKQIIQHYMDFKRFDVDDVVQRVAHLGINLQVCEDLDTLAKRFNDLQFDETTS
ncbi:hypothetical protein E3N88_13816 [Mikania micrantha]|uniref:Uncharacterized protein n=1 Tax=Mikania micrantha TaxID=192012 RepID=A0A5N6P299_9ASTR|nr:hypothetical protein E3N88_13816 [Mikania micrantha]